MIRIWTFEFIWFLDKKYLGFGAWSTTLVLVVIFATKYRGRANYTTPPQKKKYMLFPTQKINKKKSWKKTILLSKYWFNMLGGGGNSTKLPPSKKTTLFRVPAMVPSTLQRHSWHPVIGSYPNVFSSHCDHQLYTVKLWEDVKSVFVEKNDKVILLAFFINFFLSQTMFYLKNNKIHN